MRILLILVLALAEGVALAQANYTKTVELPPLRVSFADLQAVLDKAEKLASSANLGAKARREEVVMKAGAVQVTIPGRVLSPPNAKVPDQLDSLTYTYTAVEPSSVTRMNVDFSDYRRTLTVEGPSPEQVDAIFSTMREDLVALSSPIGGSGIKIVLGLPAYWMLLVILGLSGSMWYSNRGSKSLAIVLSTATVFLLLMLLPINDLLAGFLAIRGEPSFMVRYGPQISFIGLLFAVVGIPITVIQLFGTGKHTIPAPAAPPAADPSPSPPSTKKRSRSG